MNVCKKCKYAEKARMMAPVEENDPRMYRCLHPACIDPVVGTQILCMEARSYAFYCGKMGDNYEPLDETEQTKDSETVHIITNKEE